MNFHASTNGNSVAFLRDGSIFGFNGRGREIFRSKITIHPHTRDVRTHDRGGRRGSRLGGSKRVAAYPFVRVSCDF